MDILRQRMTYHKAKFVSPTIYQELCTLEIKKNGRIEHASNAHDDQIFSMLMALYVWYEGKDLVEHFGLQKDTINTDDDETIEEGLPESYENIIKEVELLDNEELQESLNFLKEGSKSVSYNDWQKQQYEADEAQLKQLLATNPIARKAYCEQNHIDLEDLEHENSMYEIPQSIFMGVYNGDGNRLDSRLDLQKQFDQITNLR